MKQQIYSFKLSLFVVVCSSLFLFSCSSSAKPANSAQNAPPEKLVSIKYKDPKGEEFSSNFRIRKAFWESGAAAQYLSQKICLNGTAQPDATYSLYLCFRINEAKRFDDHSPINPFVYPIGRYEPGTMIMSETKKFAFLSAIIDQPQIGNGKKYELRLDNAQARGTIEIQSSDAKTIKGVFNITDPQFTLSGEFEAPVSK